jgi:hypothetical protein
MQAFISYAVRRCQPAPYPRMQIDLMNSNHSRQRHGTFSLVRNRGRGWYGPRGRARPSTTVAMSIPILIPTPTRKHPSYDLNNLYRISEELPMSGRLAQQDDENCDTRLSMSQPAPSVSEGILSANDRFFLYRSRITISATYRDFLRSHP